MIKPSAGPVRTKRADRTILVVDDEPAVCHVTGQMLERQGFSVLYAVGGEEAVRLFEEHRDQVTLLLTDIVMPGLTGPALAQHLRLQRPDLPVLFVSGVVTQANFEGVMGGWMMRKPYGPSGLAAKIREVLHASASGL